MTGAVSQLIIKQLGNAFYSMEVSRRSLMALSIGQEINRVWAKYFNATNNNLLANTFRPISPIIRHSRTRLSTPQFFRFLITETSSYWFQESSWGKTWKERDRFSVLIGLPEKSNFTAYSQLSPLNRSWLHITIERTRQCNSSLQCKMKKELWWIIYFTQSIRKRSSNHKWEHLKLNY